MANESERVFANADELQAAIEADELSDKLELAAQGLTKMSVREYASARGLQPQLVYYYIRRGKIEQTPCGECGRKTINVKQADDIFLRDDKTN